MDSVFTKNEIEIFKAWLLKKKNREIADEMQTSEAYVSQTLKKIQEKINTLENSLNMLVQMGLTPPREELRLTKKGKESFEKEKEKFVEKSRGKSKGIDLDTTLSKLSKDFLSLRKVIDFGDYGKTLSEKRYIEVKNLPPRTSDYVLPYMIFDPNANWSTTFAGINRSKQVGKAPSELDYNSELLRVITERMLMSVSISKVTEDTSAIVNTLREVINNLQQLLEWLNPQGQLQQTRVRET